jgi:O-antigen/teichoic acid export membrane protein
MVKINKLFKKFEDISTIGIANILGTVISALFWLFLATIITTDEYGQISYYIAIGSVASVVALVGGNTTITVYTAKKIPIVSTVFLVSIISSAISALAVLIIIQNPIVSTYVIAYVIFVLTTSYYLGQKQFKKYSKIFIIQKILFVTLAIPLNYILGPNGVVLGISLSFFIPLYTFFKIFKEIKIDFPLLRSKINFMQNSYGKDLARVVSVQIDKIIVAPFFGFAILGNYYLGLQFLSILSILPVIVFQYTLSHDATGTTKHELKKIIIGISIIMSIAGITITPQILPVFFPEFKEAVIIVQILSIAIIPRTISAMYTSEFLGKEQSQIVLKGAIISVIIQIPLIVILGTYIGVNGIAVALVIAEFTSMLFYVIIKKIMMNKNIE